MMVVQMLGIVIKILHSLQLMHLAELSRQNKICSTILQLPQLA